MSAFFIFAGERIVCERVYFDQASILRQLGVAHDPSSRGGPHHDADQPSADDRARAAACSPRLSAGGSPRGAS